jgi:hypothetical protein
MLVEKLRNWEKIYPEDEDKPDGSLYYEAADRIEELEEKLMENSCKELWYEERIKNLEGRLYQCASEQVHMDAVAGLEEELREARLQELASLGQAQEAYEAQVKLEKSLELYQRERDRFKHNYPEMSGAYFLTGGHGEVDSNQLPEYVRICPAYGCAWEQVYVKTDKTISYEGS